MLGRREVMRRPIGKLLDLRAAAKNEFEAIVALDGAVAANRRVAVVRSAIHGSATNLFAQVAQVR